MRRLLSYANEVFRKMAFVKMLWVRDKDTLKVKVKTSIRNAATTLGVRVTTSIRDATPKTLGVTVTTSIRNYYP